MKQKKFHVGVKALIVNNRKALIFKEFKDGQELYNLPGGRIDEGENIEQALKRELKEEMGLNNFKLGSLIHVFERTDYKKNGASLLLICYEVFADIKKVVLSDEHIGFRWISKNDLKDIINNKEKMNLGTKVALEKVLK